MFLTPETFQIDGADDSHCGDCIDPTDHQSFIAAQYSNRDEQNRRGICVEGVFPTDIRESQRPSEDGKVFFDVTFEICWSHQSMFGGDSKVYKNARIIRTISLNPRDLLKPILGDDDCDLPKKEFPKEPEFQYDEMDYLRKMGGL